MGAAVWGLPSADNWWNEWEERSGFESNPSEGSTVHFSIVVPGQLSEQDSAKNSQLQGKRIQLLDKNVTSRGVLQMYAEDSGHEGF